MVEKGTLFQCGINKTFCCNNFITEDTMETALHLICKDCLQT